MSDITCTCCHSANIKPHLDGTYWCNDCDCSWNESRRRSPDLAGMKPPLGSNEWRWINGYLCCGTIRVAQDDWDTSPSQEFKQSIYDWVTTVLNNAVQAAAPSPEGWPKYEHVYCSQCGQYFGPGNAGYSCCAEHTERPLSGET